MTPGQFTHRVHRAIMLTGLYGSLLSFVVFWIGAGIGPRVSIAGGIALPVFLSIFVIGVHRLRWPPSPRQPRRYRIIFWLGVAVALGLIAVIGLGVADVVHLGIAVVAFCLLPLAGLIMAVGVIGVITAEESRQSVGSIFALMMGQTR